MFDYNSFNMAEPKRLYLARPGQHKIGQLNGIVTARLYVYLQDIWKIDVTIDKYINGSLNKLYNKIRPLMEIWVPDIGWFRIDTPGSEYQSGGRTYMTFSANGIETQLNDIDLILFYINTGTTLSYEMFDDNLDALGIPKRNIQLYISDESNNTTDENYWGLGLLNILEHNYLRTKGWSIGHVDISIASKRGRRFEIDNATCYNTLTNDVSVAYECIFTFDRINRQINAYDINNIGKSLNIECSFRNLINSVDITPQENQIYTRLHCAGANDETSIASVNFGSDSIFDLSYAITSDIFPQDFVDKYNTWVTYRESRREDYASTFTALAKYQNEISNIQNQMPSEEVRTSWNAYTLDELRTELGKYTAMLDRLEELNTIDGELQIENSNDYELYISIKDVIIPDIQNEIARQEAGSVVPSEKIEYEYMWELYGVVGLEQRRAVCQNNVDALKAAGYDKPYDAESTQLTEDAYNRQHEEYLKNVQYVEEIDARLAELNQEIAGLQAQIDELSETQQAIIDAVNVQNSSFGFTPQEIQTINILYRDTDFTDSTIEVVDATDIDDMVQSAWDLYDAAKEEIGIHCRPQYSYSISIDNLYHLPLFKDKANDIEVGDFMFLELDGGVKTKQRVIGMDIELVNFSELDLNFTFSDAVNAYGKINDFRFLLGNSNSVSKNSISTAVKQYVDSTASSIANSAINNYFSGGGVSIFPNGISSDDLLKLQDALSGLIQGSLSLEELEVKLAQIDHLDADSAFIKYLETNFLVGNQAEFKDLSALVAQINDLLAGTVSAELGHIINLTAQNVNIDEAVIRDLIASQITVAMLKAGEISTDKFNVTSDDGRLTIIGNTMQFKDKNGNIRIQIGRDANDDFTFVLYDSTGKGVLIDSTGIKESAIEDGLIKDVMIADGTITEAKLDKTGIREWTDDEGNKLFDVSKMYFGEDLFSITFEQMKTSVEQLGQQVESNKSYTIILSNEYQNIPCVDGKVKDSFNIEIPYIAYKGDEQVAASAAIGILPSGISLVSNTAATSTSEGKITLSVTKDANLGNVNTLTGYIVITFTIDDFNISKRFTWSKTNDGSEGIATFYTLESSAQIITKSDTELTPPNITLNAFMQQGTDRAPYLGRFLIRESEDGSIYTTSYMSSKDESTTQYTISSVQVKSIQCTLCVAGGITDNLDVITIPVITDGAYLESEITKVTNTVSDLSVKVDKNTQEISLKASQSDITEAINNYDGSSIKTIRDQLAEHTVSLGKITSTVSDVQTALNKKADGTTVQELTESVSQMTQDLNGFKLEVSNTYVSNTTLNGLKDEVNNRFTTNEAQIELNKDAITNKVWSSDIQEQISNIKIGAVNLITSSGEYDTNNEITWTPISTSDWSLTINGEILRVTKLTANNTWLLIPLTENLSVNENYILSANLRTSTSKTFNIYAVISEGQGVTQNESLCKISSTTTLSHYESAHIMIRDGYNFLAFKGSEFSANQYIEIYNIMLEHGTIASDWRQSNTDIELKIDTSIENVNEVIQNLDGTLSTVSQKIDSAVMEDTLGDYLSNYATNESLQDELEALVNNFNSSFVTQSQLQQTSQSLTTSITMAGGYNLIKNSVGFGTTKENTFTNWNYVNPSNIKAYAVQGSQFAVYGGESEIVLQSIQAAGGGIYQDIPTTAGVTYTIALHINPSTTESMLYDSSNHQLYALVNGRYYAVYTDGGFKLQISDTASNATIVDNVFGGKHLTPNSYTYLYTQFTATGSMTRIYFEVLDSTIIHIAGLRMVIGDNPLQWTLSSGETYSTNVRVDVEGITVYHRDDASSFTRMSPDEFAIYDKNERIAWANEDEFHMKKAVIEEAVILGNILMQTVKDTSLPKNRRGVLFISQAV